MNKLESYSLLFTDVLFENLAINPNAEFIIHSMKIFGGFNNWLILITSLSGAIISIIMNYFIGKILRKIIVIPKAIKNNQDNKVSNMLIKYWLLFLIPSVFPLYSKFAQVVVGFYGVRMSRILSICLITKLIYYVKVLFL